MGRIKTALIKRLTNELVTAHSDKLSTDFVKNKLAVDALMTPTSKKMRNVIAGYATRLMQQKTE